MTPFVDVTIVTLTRGRPAQLERAIRSVERLEGPARIEQLVLVDDCPDTAALLDARPPGRTPLRHELHARGPGVRSGPGRSAVLRNHGAAVAAGEWVAYLDDDNELEPDHIGSLLACARRRGVRAAHSWLTMRTTDGRPFVASRDPWRPDPEAARARYRWAVERGVRHPGSPVFRDRMDPPGHPDPVRTVDTGEWLLRRDLLREIPFPTDVDGRERSGSVFGEDDALMEALIEAREPVACTERATLVYHLGGYSNAGIWT